MGEWNMYDSYGTKSFYNHLDLSKNVKERDKFIKSIERIIRTSIEYKNYIRYLKTEASLSYCKYLNKLPEEINKAITVEMHHYPLTLYTIVNTVLEKYVANRKPFTRLSISNEVMDLHYNLQVSIIPLTLTLHQLAHTGNLKISTSNVFGDYTKFVEMYDIYIPEDDREDLKSLEKMSKNENYILEFNKDTLSLDREGLFGEVDETVKVSTSVNPFEEEFDD